MVSLRKRSFSQLSAHFYSEPHKQLPNSQRIRTMFQEDKLKLTGKRDILESLVISVNHIEASDLLKPQLLLLPMFWFPPELLEPKCLFCLGWPWLSCFWDRLLSEDDGPPPTDLELLLGMLGIFFLLDTSLAAFSPQGIKVSFSHIL